MIYKKNNYNINPRKILFMIETKRLRIYPASEEQLENFIENEKYGDLKKKYKKLLRKCRKQREQWNWNTLWMVELKKGKHIGQLYFGKPSHNPSYNGLTKIIYIIDNYYPGKGYATEIIKAASEWAFQQPNVKIIEAERMDVDIWTSLTLKSPKCILKKNGNSIKYDLKAMSFIDVYEVLEENYDTYFENEIKELISKNPKDEVLNYFNNRLTNFKVWKESKKLYDHLDTTAKVLFISITDKYGRGWKLRDLFKFYCFDRLIIQMDSYLCYLDRVYDFYSCFNEEDLSSKN